MVRKKRLVDIKGFEGVNPKYVICDNGELLGVNGKPIGTTRSDGYRIVNLTLRPGEKQTLFYIHRLVALAFINEIPGKDYVNHINENSSDNRVDNLEWVSHIENCQHGTRNQRTGEKLAVPVIGTCVKTGWQFGFKSMMEAQRVSGFDCQHISACVRQKRETHKGFRWEVDDYRTQTV